MKIFESAIGNFKLPFNCMLDSFSCEHVDCEDFVDCKIIDISEHFISLGEFSSYYIEKENDSDVVDCMKIIPITEISSLTIYKNKNGTFFADLKTKQGSENHMNGRFNDFLYDLKFCIKEEKNGKSSISFTNEKQ